MNNQPGHNVPQLNNNNLYSSNLNQGYLGQPPYYPPGPQQNYQQNPYMQQQPLAQSHAPTGYLAHFNQKAQKEVQKNPILQDNSKARQSAINKIEEGKRLYIIGNLEEKEMGLNKIIEGISMFQAFVKREPPQNQESLKGIYANMLKELEEKFKEFNEQKQKLQNNPIACTSGDRKNGGKKSEDKDDFKDKLAGAIVTEKPNIKWEDIAGLANAKAALKETVIMPARFPNIFEQNGIKPWKGILLYGPPGTGKTFLAKACATEADSTFLSVSSSDLVSKYVGESAKLIKSLFGLARDKRPAIIFIDEIDALCGDRSGGDKNDSSIQVINEFLVQMDGVGTNDKGILVLGTTNIPWSIDAAIRRRFQKRILIPLPDEPARRYMLNKNVASIAQLSETDMNTLVQKTDGYSASDISIMINQAKYATVSKLQSSTHFKRCPDGKWTPCESTDEGATVMNYLQLTEDQLNLPKPNISDFLRAVQSSKKSVDQTQLERYTKWTQEFGQDG